MEVNPSKRRTEPQGAWYHDYDGYYEDYTGQVIPPEDDDYYFRRNVLPYGGGFNPKNMMTDNYNSGRGAVPALYDPKDGARGNGPGYHDQQQRQDGFRPAPQDTQQDADRLQMEMDRQRYNDDYFTGGRYATEWVPPEQFSPRKSTNDPNYQRAAGDPRSQVNEQRYAYDRQFTPRMTRSDAAAGATVSRALGKQPYKPGGAFLFLRFPLQRGENTSCVAKACIQAKTSDLGGRFVGIARKVFDFGYPPGLDDGCAVFQFPSLANAEIFYESDKRIRQHDFPPPQGHAEVYCLSLTKDPNTMQLFDTFLMSEVSLNASIHEPRISDAAMAQYQEEYVTPFSDLLRERDALPYAAFSRGDGDRKSLRRHFFPNKVLVTLHLFRGPKHLESVMEEPMYSNLRAKHNSLATERCSIFTIDRQACP